MLYKSKILTLVTMYIVGMFMSIVLWAQVAVFTQLSVL